MTDFFKFPCIIIDEDQENKKKFLYASESDSDIIVGEAEDLFYKFSSIIDYWAPTQESRENASMGKFDTCLVRFEDSTYMVPMSKEEFKKRWQNFADKRKEEVSSEQDEKIYRIDINELRELIKSEG